MSLLTPKLKRILVPPTIPPSSIAVGTTNKASSTNFCAIEIASTLLSAQLDLNTACGKSSAINHTTPTTFAGNAPAQQPQPPPPLQRHVTLHPCKSLVAYVLNPFDVVISSNIYKVIVVQNTATKEIVYSLSWIDLASSLYGETDIKKLPAATKSLGIIQSLQFYDPSILYWSRVMTSAATNTNTASLSIVHDRFFSLAIQTDKRVILLNLRKGSNGNQVLLHSNASVIIQVPYQSSLIKKSPFRTILGHLCEKTIGSIPSSNILPLTDRWVLIGCMDGSMKCYDWITGTTVKKIKGLGKGDWIVKLLAANRYVTDPTSLSTTDGGSTSGMTGTGTGSLTSGSITSSTGAGGSGSGGLRRILTVTKKGIVYLIEIEIDVEKDVMDIQPPLGRFYIGSPVEVPAVDTFDTTTLSAGTGAAGGANSTNSSGPNPTSIGPGGNNTISSNASSSEAHAIGPIMEHTIISYDPHMDRLLWLTTTNTTSTMTGTGGVGGPASISGTTTKNYQQTLSVWNLRALQQDFIQQANVTTSSGGSSKNLFKPDPTLIIQFPTTGSGTSSSSIASTVAVIPVHPAFTGDTVVCVTLSSTGDLFLHGAIGLAANTTQTIVATPVVGINLTTMLTQSIPSILEAEQLGDANSSSSISTIVRVHASASQSLPSSGCTELIIGTNVGIFVVEFPTIQMAGTHHCHFGAGLGNVGKSILAVRGNSALEYATVDSLTINPVGVIEPKNPMLIYECPIAKHMPIEIQKRPFRSPPTFLTSPSGIFVCMLWSTEYRYDIVHIPTVLQKVGQRVLGTYSSGSTGSDLNTSGSRNPIVATGYGIADFAWLEDEDIFCVLHAEDLMAYSSLFVPKKIETGDGGYTFGLYYSQQNSTQRDAPLLLGNVASLATSVTKSATTGAVNAVTKVGSTVEVATQGVRVGAKAVMKSFLMFGGGKGKKNNAINRRGSRGDGGVDIGSSITADDLDDSFSESGPSSAALTVPSAAEMAALEQTMKNSLQPVSSETTNQIPNQRYVEIKKLTLTSTGNDPSEMASTLSHPVATVTTLGEIALRGGKRSRPIALFGGPVLCIASNNDEKGSNSSGQAYFYTRKPTTTADEMDNAKPIKASSYSSSGPAMPTPKLLTWDDDGTLCAIVIDNRITVYVSNGPDFMLLGSVRIVSPTMVNSDVTNIRFVHGTLFCCTYNSVHCVLLGNYDAKRSGIGSSNSSCTNSPICKLDSYLLASTDVPIIPPVTKSTASSPSEVISNLAPVPVSLPLVQPTILGYQSGSLFVSTLRGVQAVPLHCPLLRIGLLLADGHVTRAARWLDAVPNQDHEELASFLERRGHPELAIQLAGLSLETIVDLSMRYGYVDKLEEVVETFGVTGIRSIDMGRGVSPTIFGPCPTPHSVVVCIGAFLLAHGRVELTRRLATECLRTVGDDGKKDAFMLGTLLLPVDEADANRLMTRAVEEGTGGSMAEEWLIGKFAREHHHANTTAAYRRT